MNTSLSINEIEGLDVELATVCNLRCPLCLSQLMPDKVGTRDEKTFLDIDYLIRELEKMPALETLSLAGDASEPTLHPELLKLLDYVKNRKGLFLELFTNASAHSTDYWKELAGHFSENSVVYFTICGSTQELHSRYRVGSSLDKVVENALAFKSASPYPNDYMQYIRFQYNKNDSMNAVMSILKKFSKYGFVETDPVWERLHLDDNDDNGGICSTKVFSFMYKSLLKKAIGKKRRSIRCISFDEKYVRMDAHGRYAPCVCYLVNRPGNAMKDGKIDYSDILADRCPFCYECDSEVLNFMHMNNRDSYYVCC